MANPNNAIGTNGAFGGRTSPNAFNDVLGAFDGRGVISGWEAAPSSGMAIVLGGDGISRDVAIAEDNIGNKLTVDNINGTPITLEIGAAPATNSRIDAVVVYINNPPQGSASAVDNYGAVHILDVAGISSSDPVAPDDSTIRTAITADGASGATAYYVVLALIAVPAGTTDITANMITSGPAASLSPRLGSVPDGYINTPKLADGAVTDAKLNKSSISQGSSSTDIVIGSIDGEPLYRKIQTFSNIGRGFSTHTYTNPISNLKAIVNIGGVINTGSSSAPINSAVPDNVATYSTVFNTFTSSGYATVFGTGVSTTNSGYIIIDYLKNS